MLCVAGTIPEDNFPLVEGTVEIRGNELQIGSSTIDIHRGTAALLAAAVMAAAALKQAAPFACLVGDTGTGKGSIRLYRHMIDALPHASFQTITLHYLQPIIRWQKSLQAVMGNLKPRPCLIADAGFMYAAKMSGEACLYDLFTPDVGELAFLADEEAPHPFYTRGFILHEENRVPDLIARAYKHGNAARHLIVKGAKDYLADENGILETVDQPVVEALEAIGGTGDTLTGLVSVLIDAGMNLREAAVAAIRINRLTGRIAQPTPATQIDEIIKCIPQAIRALREAPSADTGRMATG
ncbi:MAG: sugar kinase [Deltaproteobacteria bacterium]|nr:sugar kinase [Deltaproteobacteria bacterium]